MEYSVQQTISSLSNLIDRRKQKLSILKVKYSRPPVFPSEPETRETNLNRLKLDIGDAIKGIEYYKRINL